MTDWRELKASHSGRCFILGNGPSLLDHDLSKIEHPCIGVNMSYLKKKTNYHVVADLSAFGPEVDEAALKTIPYVFSVEGRHGEKDYAILLKDLGHKLAWSFDMEHGVFPRFSTYIALQLAAWMDFAECVLLGVDLCEHKGQGHFYNKPMADFFKHQRRCFRFVAALAKEYPLPRIVNCSRISKLDVFPKVEFGDVAGKGDDRWGN